MYAVGYAGNGLCDGATISAPQFMSIGKNGKFNLQDFAGLGPDASYSIAINLLNPRGGIIKAYVWCEDYGDSGDQKCWLDADTYELPEEDVFFEQGQAFWVEAQNEDQGIQSSGEVPVNDATIQLCDGATLCGNFTPAKIALQDIIASGTDASYSVAIDILNPRGGIIKAYVWCEDYGDNGDQKCWLDADTYELPEEEVFFEPGQAFWVEAQSDEQYITFPGVELTK